MKRQKKNSSVNKIRSENLRKINITNNRLEVKLRSSIFFRNLSLILIFITSVTAPVFYVYYSYKKNNFLSFPLDDPWIHLTFARNLLETYSFSYFPGEAAVAGSTSPLYTILIVPGMLITSDEMILSYTLGIAFFVLSAFIFYRLTTADFNNDMLFCLLCTLIYSGDLLLNFIAVSGMETSLYVLLLLTGTILYKKRKAVQLGIIMGLIIWTRPDGAAFIMAVIADYLIFTYWVRDVKEKKFFSRKNIIHAGIILALFSGLYGLMNYLMSGSVLPTTFNAKVAYYIDMSRRMNYLYEKVGGMFTYAHYIFFFIPFVFSALKVIFDAFKRKNNVNTLYFAFIIFFVMQYWIKLPEVNRFYRYLLPVLPFYLLMSMCGIRDLLGLLGRIIKLPKLFTGLQYIFMVFIIVYAVINYFINADQYVSQNKFIYERQVRAAKWINENTKEDDIIATHDIGAIGYYGKRKIIDVAGLVNNDLAKHINEDDYPAIMTEYLDKNGADYVAFMPEWYILANQNYSFRGPEQFTKENMIVSKYIPGKTYVIPRKAQLTYMKSIKHMLSGQGKELVKSMNDLIAIDSGFAYSYYYRGYGNLLQKDTAAYMSDMEHALKLFPDFKEALTEYGVTLIQKNRIDEAKGYLERAHTIDPENEKVKGALEYISRIVE